MYQDSGMRRTGMWLLESHQDDIGGKRLREDSSPCVKGIRNATKDT